MFSIKSESNPIGLIHTVRASTIELASEVLEAANRHDYFAETDPQDARRVLVFYISDNQMDELIKAVREAFDSLPLLPIKTLLKKAA